jgi:cbb3-type cytochrome oxidase subunit 3
MSVVAWIGASTTLLSMLAFAVVVWWAYGGRRAARHADAARVPFALPDDLAPQDARREGRP